MSWNHYNNTQFLNNQKGSFTPEEALITSFAIATTIVIVNIIGCITFPNICQNIQNGINVE